jgi:hypothetical protein
MALPGATVNGAPVRSLVPASAPGVQHDGKPLIYATLAYTADLLELPETRPLVNRRRWLRIHRRRVTARLSRPQADQDRLDRCITDPADGP